MKENNLKLQLSAPSALVLLLVLFGLALWASQIIKQVAIDSAFKTLEHTAFIIEKNLVKRIRLNSPEEILNTQQVIQSQAKKLGLRIAIVDFNRNLYLSSYVGTERGFELNKFPDLKKGFEAFNLSADKFSRLIDHKNDLIYLTYKTETLGLIIRIGESLEPISAIYESAQINLLLLATGLGLLSCLLMFISSGRVARPISQIRQGVLKFAKGDLDSKIPDTTVDWLKPVAASMNNMAAELKSRILALETQSSELESVLSSMAEGVVAIDNRQRLLKMNSGAAKVLNLQDIQEFEGKAIKEIFRNSDLQRFAEKALESDVGIEEELVIFGRGERSVKTYSRILSDPEGKKLGILLVLNDVTRIRRLERMRRDFVANVSHELKTPITSIRGSVETLIDGAVDRKEDAQRFLGIILRHTERLGMIVDDLLSRARLEDEKERSRVQLTSANLRDILLATIQMCELKAYQKNVKIELQCPELLKAKINHLLLEQAMVNLVDNAIKYSDPNSQVVVKAEQVADSVELSVQDFGVGIAAEHLPRLFERFYRVDRARSRKLGGTGLGLAIVKHIAQVHGGQAWVNSNPGKGSVFKIILPN